MPSFNYVPSSQGDSTLNLALIGHVVSEKMFENNGHIHVYSPEAGAYNSLGQLIFQNLKSSVNLVICCKNFPVNYYVTVFPIQTYR